MNLDRITIFALFWIAVGMLLMVFIQYKIVGLLIALGILVYCYCIRNRCR